MLSSDELEPGYADVENSIKEHTAVYSTYERNADNVGGYFEDEIPVYVSGMTISKPERVEYTKVILMDDAHFMRESETDRPKSDFPHSDTHSWHSDTPLIDSELAPDADVNNSIEEHTAVYSAYGRNTDNAGRYFEAYVNGEMVAKIESVEDTELSLKDDAHFMRKSHIDKPRNDNFEHTDTDSWPSDTPLIDSELATGYIDVKDSIKENTAMHSTYERNTGNVGWYFEAEIPAYVNGMMVAKTESVEDTELSLKDDAHFMRESDNDQLKSDFEHCHTDSCPSDTPMIDSDTTHGFSNKANYTFTDMVTSGAKLDIGTFEIFGKTDAQFKSVYELADSLLSVHGDEKIEEKAFTPLHVIGSGWEFGSISSIHLQGWEGSRSRANTIDRQSGISFRREGFNQNSLLAKVFSNLGSLEFSNKRDNAEGISASFIRLSSVTTGEQKSGKHDFKSTNNFKNLFALVVSLLFLFTSIYGLRNLQSSLNSEGGIGVYALAASFGAFMIGSLISPFVVKRFMPKICIIVGCLGELIFTIANFYPTAFSVIPSSAVNGFCSALMWNAVCTYITETGMNEAVRKNKVLGHVLSRFFGLLFVSMQLAMVIGNLISSLILLPSGKVSLEGNETLEEVIKHTSYAAIDNNTIDYTSENEITNKSSVICGIRFCEEEQAAEIEKKERLVSDLNKFVLLGTYAGCIIIAILIVQCFVDRLPNYTPTTITRKQILTQVGSVLRMLVNPHFCFVILMCMYTMMSNAFVIADILKAYVTCPLGIYMVGYSMICFGMFGAISSFTCGKLVKHVGTVTVFIVAAVINVTSLVFMCLWEPTADDIYYIFALLGAWGFADGIWQSQINGLLSTVFADRYEDAFGCCRVLQGCGGVIVYAMSNSCCMVTKVIFTGVCCLLTLISFIYLEIILWMRNRSKMSVEIEVS